jgi:hypothetical protein
VCKSPLIRFPTAIAESSAEMSRGASLSPVPCPL